MTVTQISHRLQRKRRGQVLANFSSWEQRISKEWTKRMRKCTSSHKRDWRNLHSRHTVHLQSCAAESATDGIHFFPFNLARHDLTQNDLSWTTVKMSSPHIVNGIVRSGFTKKTSLMSPCDNISVTIQKLVWYRPLLSPDITLKKKVTPSTRENYNWWLDITVGPVRDVSITVTSTVVITELRHRWNMARSCSGCLLATADSSARCTGSFTSLKRFKRLVPKRSLESAVTELSFSTSQTAINVISSLQAGLLTDSSVRASRLHSSDRRVSLQNHWSFHHWSLV